MKRAILVLCVIIFITASAVAFTQRKRIREFLTGFEEVPVVSTVAEGEFHARISDDATRIDYELSYSGLEGNVTQAHIHVGQRGVNGGISVWLCGNLGPGVVPPPGTPACPPSPATVTGTLTAEDVVGPVAQGIAAAAPGVPGEFGELIRAIRAGKTYANVHSSKFPTGEIRSQIEAGQSGHDH